MHICEVNTLINVGGCIKRYRQKPKEALDDGVGIWGNPRFSWENGGESKTDVCFDEMLFDF